MGIDISRHEAQLLKKASNVDFPILVYKGKDFDPHAMKIRTPQVVTYGMVGSWMYIQKSHWG